MSFDVKKKIKKTSYNSLLKILLFLNNEKIKRLSKYLKIFHQKCKRRLFIFILEKITIAIQKNKQSSEVEKSKHIVLYFFDMRNLINVVLFSSWSVHLHTEMTKIVDKLFELFHDRFWNFSIQTCFDDFIQYVDEIFIFFSDFVQYCEIVNEKIISNLKQMIFFDRDHKKQSRIRNQELF